MPHLTLQITPNVTIAHEEALLKRLNQALWDSGHFDKPTDIKTRIIPITTFLVGIEDDEQAYGFVYAQLKIMAGRDSSIRHQLAEQLVVTLEETLGTEQSGRSAIQLCVAVEEIEAVYHKKYLVVDR